LPSIPSALALMFAKPTLMSLAQYGTRPTHHVEATLASLAVEATTRTKSVGARSSSIGSRLGGAAVWFR
jgi:hypothetical protein